MSNSAPNDDTQPGPPPTLPPSSLRAAGSSGTLHDLLNFPSPQYDAPPPRQPPHAVSYGHAQQPQSGMSYYSPYQQQQQAPQHANLHGYDPHQHQLQQQQGSYALHQQQQPVASTSTSAYHLSSAGYPPGSYVGGSYDPLRSGVHEQQQQQRIRRDSIPSSLASADDGLDQQQQQQQYQQQHQQSSAPQQQQQQQPRPPAQVIDVPESVIAGLAGRQLTEKKRKWRAKAGVQGPGKSWRKGLKDADRPPPPSTTLVGAGVGTGAAGGSYAAASVEPSYVPEMEEPRESHPLEPDWQSPLALSTKKRKLLTEKNRSRFVAAAPAVKFNQAWITAEPLMNKGEAKRATVRRWKIGNRSVRSITGLQWVSKNGWVGDQESALSTLIQDQKLAAAQAAAAAYQLANPQPNFAPASNSGTPIPEGPSSGYLAPPPGSSTTAASSSQPHPQLYAAYKGPGGMGIGMPHEKHRLYALTREAEANAAAAAASAQSAGPSSREGSVLSVGSDGTGL